MHKCSKVGGSAEVEEIMRKSVQPGNLQVGKKERGENPMDTQAQKKKSSMQTENRE